MTDDEDDELGEPPWLQEFLRAGRDEPRYWILNDDDEPEPVDAVTWGLWFETHRDRRVILRDVVRRDIEVSTVFVGLNGTVTPTAPPTLWESMVFGGLLDGHRVRYTSKLDALEGHADCVRVIDHYYTVPRKTKKALRKFWTNPGGCRLRPREQRRLLRALTTV